MPDEKNRKDEGTPDEKGSPFDFLSDDLTSSGPENPDESKDESKKGDFGALTGGKKDSGLGNLPPLSDFDSQQGGEKQGEKKDRNLPPLGSVTPESGGGAASGLPPLSDISVDTPVPSAGKPGKQASFGDAGAFDTPISDSGLDTPTKGAGFQDLAADSDFSPETPEIGPGPDSDLETPLFDSAFGGGRSFTAAADTPAPTQAMETPMFGGVTDEKSGAGQDNLGFDAGAFSAGTPIPDFSPDTGVQKPVTAPPAAPKPKKVKSGGGIGVTLIAAAIALIVGLVAGPYMYKVLSFWPNPSQTDLAAARNQITTLQATLASYKGATRQGGKTISQKELNKLAQQQKDLNDDITKLTSQKDTLSGDIDKAKQERDHIQQDIEAKNEEYASAQSQLEDLVNQTSIVRARQEGLNAEVKRLESLNGKLNVADARRVADKNTLLHNIDLLAIQIREGIPLTPQKYSRDKRIAAVSALKSKVSNSPWVSPTLLEQYTSLYQQELKIAASRDYFFAKIPVTDRIGNKDMKWAECLMNGNWSVYYRTLDGKNIGAYENTASSGPPNYQFVEHLPSSDQKRIAREIMAARTPDYLDEISVLAKQEVSAQNKTPIQRVFDSL